MTEDEIIEFFESQAASEASASEPSRSLEVTKAVFFALKRYGLSVESVTGSTSDGMTLYLVENTPMRPCKRVGISVDTRGNTLVLLSASELTERSRVLPLNLDDSTASRASLEKIASFINSK